MTHREALETLARHRGERIVVTTMGSISIWPQLSDTPLDFAYMPSAMGHGPALGLGLAMAHPERGVIVLNGDGCTLMNPGSLVTLASHPAEVPSNPRPTLLGPTTRGGRTHLWRGWGQAPYDDEPSHNTAEIKYDRQVSRGVPSGRRACGKMGAGCPPTPVFPWDVSPLVSLAPGP